MVCSLQVGYLEAAWLFRYTLVCGSPCCWAHIESPHLPSKVLPLVYPFFQFWGAYDESRMIILSAYLFRSSCMRATSWLYRNLHLFFHILAGRPYFSTKTSLPLIFQAFPVKHLLRRLDYRSLLRMMYVLTSDFFFFHTKCPFTQLGAKKVLVGVLHKVFWSLKTENEKHMVQS